MKYVRQFGIILAVSFIGELLKYFIPLPIPASIYGLLIMLIALKTRIIPLHKVKDAGDFLIEIMPLMFIPAAVGILTSWKELHKILIPAIIVIVITTIIVMIVSGRITQAVLKANIKTNNESN
jgi:holin-like protein